LFSGVAKVSTFNYSTGQSTTQTGVNAGGTGGQGFSGVFGGGGGVQ
jgi:hypothetical protein